MPVCRQGYMAADRSILSRTDQGVTFLDLDADILVLQQGEILRKPAVQGCQFCRIRLGEAGQCLKENQRYCKKPFHPEAVSFDIRENHASRNEHRDVAVMADDISHGRRGDVGIFLGGRDDDRVHFRIEMTVGIGDRLLVVEIRHIPDTSDNVSDAKLAADVHGKPVIADDSHPLKTLAGLPDDVLALIDGELAPLGLVDADCHHHLVEDGQGSDKYVQMSGCERWCTQ